MSRAVIVLGMLRSGTSLVANMLHEFGAFIEDNKFEPDEKNERGYWESAELAEVNTGVLESVGYSQEEPPPLFSRWERSEAVGRLGPKAQQFVGRMSRHEFWACKHPATTVTLPFWLPYLPKERSFVICVRNPTSVARSMVDWKFDEYAVSRLWTAYYLSALANTDHEKRLFVFYEDFASDLGGQVERLRDFLQAGITDAPNRVYSKALSHQRVTTEELFRSDHIRWGSKLLYLLMESGKRYPQILSELTTALSLAGQVGELPLWSVYDSEQAKDEVVQLRREIVQLREIKALYERLSHHPYVRFGRKFKAVLKGMS